MLRANKTRVFSSKSVMGRVKLRVCLALLVLSLCPSFVGADVYQWTDPRGVVHFTDNFLSVPDAFRNSPKLIIHHDVEPKRKSSEISTAEEPSGKGVIDAPQAPEAAGPREQELSGPSQPVIYHSPPPVVYHNPPPVVYYSPQYFQIVVVNPAVRHPHKKPCLIPEGCKPSFRPNFDDRRFIHPSVFDGGSRRLVHPKSSKPARR
jgi:hypothetical protein